MNKIKIKVGNKLELGMKGHPFNGDCTLDDYLVESTVLSIQKVSNGAVKFTLSWWKAPDQTTYSTEPIILLDYELKDAINLSNKIKNNIKNKPEEPTIEHVEEIEI